MVAFSHHRRRRGRPPCGRSWRPYARFWMVVDRLQASQRRPYRKILRPDFPWARVKKS